MKLNGKIMNFFLLHLIYALHLAKKKYSMNNQLNWSAYVFRYNIVERFRYSLEIYTVIIKVTIKLISGRYKIVTIS